MTVFIHLFVYDIPSTTGIKETFLQDFLEILEEVFPCYNMDSGIFSRNLQIHINVLPVKKELIYLFRIGSYQNKIIIVEIKFRKYINI